MAYETIIVKRDGAVALLQLNRPQALNALNVQLIRELNGALAELDADDTVAAIVITGNDKAFAAGADIKEMQDLSYTDASMGGHFDGWDDAAKCRKPVIAAVAGFALGGGCEIAMMCDFIIAADTARFGQPEIKLGTLPGIGGTQRLTRAVGKAKAMEMCLTGRMMNAEEAERAGLVSRVVAADKLIEEAMAAAQAIAGLSRAAVRMAKESVNRAHESTLTEGLRFERNMFFSTFALEDQKEGMRAFVEKRAANWKHR
ncbi:MAG: enoyl-CoA hydratase [Gammaproteobacteria bacterium]|jgi:enoyl-CoA hydratase